MSAPFNRATMLTNAIKAIVRSGLNEVDKRLALNSLPTYRSRGHGKGKLARNFWQNASKYMPHQGGKEMARRRVQLGIDRRTP